MVCLQTTRHIDDSIMASHMKPTSTHLLLECFEEDLWLKVISPQVDSMPIVSALASPLTITP